MVLSIMLPTYSIRMQDYNTYKALFYAFKKELARKHTLKILFMKITIMVVLENNKNKDIKPIVVLEATRVNLSRYLFAIFLDELIKKDLPNLRNYTHIVFYYK